MYRQFSELGHLLYVHHCEVLGSNTLNYMKLIKIICHSLRPVETVLITSAACHTTGVLVVRPFNALV